MMRLLLDGSIFTQRRFPSDENPHGAAAPLVMRPVKRPDEPPEAGRLENTCATSIWTTQRRSEASLPSSALLCPSQKEGVRRRLANECR